MGRRSARAMAWLKQNAVALIGAALSAWALWNTNVIAVRTQRLETATRASELRTRVAVLRDSVQAKYLRFESLIQAGRSADYDARKVSLELKATTDGPCGGRKALG